MRSTVSCPSRQNSLKRRLGKRLKRRMRVTDDWPNVSRWKLEESK
ncbi:unnamed protein product [Nippostrongylus brasiliensis]|uniref:Uncharacterized protein n=1 Tax=Nippostrongylus brasiliensis TaxID=27835 RepID=A0A0N4XRQ9_NIPBR|nr:unnamed protein product [Nippostrongylus brasiliensis]